MKKLVVLVVTVAVALVLGSCVSTSQSIAGRTIPLADATYTILGETTAKAEGTVILYFIPIVDNKAGTIGWSVSNPADFSLILMHR